MQQRLTELEEIVADFNIFFSEIDRKTRKNQGTEDERALLNNLT